MNQIQASFHKMISNVYTVTVIDLRNLLPLGIRRTPLICTELEDAIYAVKNNMQDLADGATYQYAVIEQTILNVVRPNIEGSGTRFWYKYNSVIDEFEPCEVPIALRNQTGFGIG
jgi:hypothetical protein